MKYEDAKKIFDLGIENLNARSSDKFDAYFISSDDINEVKLNMERYPDTLNIPEHKIICDKKEYAVYGFMNGPHLPIIKKLALPNQDYL